MQRKQHEYANTKSLFRNLGIRSNRWVSPKKFIYCHRILCMLWWFSFLVCAFGNELQLHSHYLQKPDAKHLWSVSSKYQLQNCDKCNYHDAVSFSELENSVAILRSSELCNTSSRGDNRAQMLKKSRSECQTTAGSPRYSIQLWNFILSFLFPSWKANTMLILLCNSYCSTAWVPVTFKHWHSFTTVHHLPLQCPDH